MNRGFDREKEFLLNLERLLAGEEAVADTLAEQDDIDSLNFARKMIALRPAPSPDFKSRLKTRLVARLVEMEETGREEKKRSWFSWFGSYPFVWQAVTVILFCMMVGTIMWGSGLFDMITETTTTATTATTTTSMTTTGTTTTSGTTTTTTTATTTATTTTSGTTIPSAAMILEASAETDASSYQTGENVYIKVYLRNVTSEPVEIEKFPPIMSLMREGVQEAVYTYTPQTYVKTIKPGETVSFVVSWDQIDNKNQNVLPGEYYVELEELYYDGQTIKLDLDRSVRFTIQPDS